MSLPSLQTLVLALAALGAFLSVLAIGLPLLERDEKAGRRKAVLARRSGLARQQKEAMLGRGNRLAPRRHVNWMKAVLARLKLENLLDDKATKLRLAQAGWRKSSHLVSFIFARVAVPVVMLAVTLLYLQTPLLAGLPTPVKPLIAGGALLIGATLPHLLVKNALDKRQAELTKSFPDALDLLLICVEAGQSIEAALQRVTEEMAAQAPVLIEEFALTQTELVFLANRQEAFDNLAARTGLPAIKSLCTALSQSERYGTPVAVALRVLAQENREARMAAAEKKAAALPAKLTVPMIVFFLPVLFLVIVAPAAMKISAMWK